MDIITFMMGIIAHMCVMWMWLGWPKNLFSDEENDVTFIDETESEDDENTESSEESSFNNMDETADEVDALANSKEEVTEVEKKSASSSWVQLWGNSTE